jgi:Fic family protein
MVVVVLSGIVGRYIYIQIPRTLSGKALSYEEIQNELSRSLMEIRRLLVSTGKDVSLLSADLKGVRAEDSIVFDGLKNQIRQAEIGGKPKREALKILRKMQITRFRMQRLDKMQRLFSYWHIFHKPFAIIMMVIVIVHIAVTLAMGYTWIF